MLIGGALVESEGGGWDVSIEPATERPLGRTPAATATDVARAVDAAETAWPDWSRAGPARRMEALNRLADGIEARADELLGIEVRDTGNAITAMANDVRNTVGWVRYFAAVAQELKGETIPGAPGMIHFTEREPYGVVARIAPFNHPLLFCVGRTAAALAAGNAVVVKPPETSPLSAMVLAEICQAALPAGVFNIVTGSGRTAGDALVRHPGVKRIAFIGSTATGRAIQMAAAESGVKHVSLELGGKNPMIVFPDCDPDAVAEAAVSGMNFTWQGQSCGSTSRLFLHEDIYQPVLERVLERVGRIRLGDPLAPDTQMGPVNSAAMRDRVEHYIAAGRADGARLLAGGGRPEGAEFRAGYWVQPTVFGDVAPGMRIAREEIFGPVLSVLRWRDIESLIEEVNAPEYGLTAAIWTRDIDTALGIGRRVRAGFLWINTVSAHYRGVPFGGQKASGVGREECLDELYSYTETKAFNIALRPPRLR